MLNLDTVRSLVVSTSFPAVIYGWGLEPPEHGCPLRPCGSPLVPPWQSLSLFNRENRVKVWQPNNGQVRREDLND